MTVAQKIKSLVNDRGITYTFISKKTGMSVDAISKSFAGKRKLHADEMIAICNVVGIKLDDLNPLTTRQHAPRRRGTNET